MKMGLIEPTPIRKLTGLGGLGCPGLLASVAKHKLLGLKHV